MKSGKLSLANSTDKPVREVKQNDTEPPVKVVQALGEEGENEIRILAKCPDLNSLQSLWEDYRSGHLNTALERLLLTDDIKEKFGVESISINTTILEKDYQACREYLSENIRFGRNSEAEKEMARAAECAKKLEKEEKEEEKDWMDI